jgi:hypothetical protein
METIYPALEKAGVFLPVFWLIRLERYFRRMAVNRMEEKFRISKRTFFRFIWRKYQAVNAKEAEEIIEIEEKKEIEENKEIEDKREIEQKNQKEEKTAEIPK